MIDNERQQEILHQRRTALLRTVKLAKNSCTILTAQSDLWSLATMYCQQLEAQLVEVEKELAQGPLTQGPKETPLDAQGRPETAQEQKDARTHTQEAERPTEATLVAKRTALLHTFKLANDACDSLVRTRDGLVQASAQRLLPAQQYAWTHADTIVVKLKTY